MFWAGITISIFQMEKTKVQYVWHHDHITYPTNWIHFPLDSLVSFNLSQFAFLSPPGNHFLPFHKSFLQCESISHTIVYILFFFFFLRNKVAFIHYPFFFSPRATPAACGGSQARGLNGAVAIGLGQSHSNAGSKPCLWPTPQLMAMPDP